MFKPIQETTGIRPRTPRSKTPTSPGRPLEPEFPGGPIRIPTRRLQTSVNPAYNEGVDSMSNQTVANLLTRGRMSNFQPINLASDSKLATEFYNFYNKPEPEPDGYMGAHYNPRTATLDDLNNWLSNVKNQALAPNRRAGIYSIYQTIMNKSSAIAPQPFGRVSESYTDEGSGSRQAFLDVLHKNAESDFTPQRQLASIMNSGIDQLLSQFGIDRNKLLPSIFTINDTAFISSDILSNNLKVNKKKLVDFICNADIIELSDFNQTIQNELQAKLAHPNLDDPDMNITEFQVLVAPNLQTRNPLSLKSIIVDAVNAFDQDRKPPSANDIPIFIVLEIGYGFHTAVILKIKEKLYSFGYGYSTIDENTSKVIDSHTGMGGIYSPDYLINYHNKNYRNRIIDIGVLKPYHVTKIQDYLSRIEDILSSIQLAQSDNIELKGNILSGSSLPKYNTVSSKVGNAFLSTKVGNAVSSFVGIEQQLNCASFISSIFPSVKSGMFISSPSSSVGSATDKKIADFQRLYLENDVDGIKELLCDECCGIDCSKCGEPISEAATTCSRCCYTNVMTTVKGIEKSRNPILKNTGLSCLAGKCREHYEPSDTQEMREPLIYEPQGEHMDRGGKLKRKIIRYASRKTRKLKTRKLKTRKLKNHRKLKPRKSRKIRNKNTRKYI